MQTQRDHVHAHQFMMGRLTCALVQGDPTTAQIPGRRAMTGLLAGALITILVVAGFAVYGWIVPGGSKAYTEAGVILVENETGNRYVYRDGVLYETANLTSAMLIQGSSARVKRISRASLQGLPRGQAVGIPAAPQSVSPDMVVAGPWLVCLPGSVTDKPGAGLGLNLDPKAVAEPLKADRFTVVQSSGGTSYLITGGRKFAVGDSTVLAVVGASAVRQAVAPEAWLDLLPTGVTLKPVAVPEANQPGPTVGGREHLIGTLFQHRAETGTEQWFVLGRDGLAALTRTEFLLAAAKSSSAPVQVDTGALARAPMAAGKPATGRIPDLTGLTWQDPGSAVLCLRQTPASAEEVTSAVAFTAIERSGVKPDGEVSVLAAPNTAMVITPVPREKQGTPEMALLSDRGVAFPLADANTVAALRLDAGRLTPFPKTLLTALSPGPVLSREAAAASMRG